MNIPVKAHLSEKNVKAALAALSWTLLQTHLDEIELDVSSFEVLLGHLRRSHELLLKYPNPSRDKKRTALYAGLTEYVAERLDAVEAAKIVAIREQFAFIEGGYRGILNLLDKCEAARLPIQIRIPAYIERANQQYRSLTERVLALMLKGGEFNAMSGLLLKDENGREHSADALLDAVVTTLTSTLLMEGYKENLFEVDGALKLPAVDFVTEQDRYKVGSTEVLGIIWKRWERAERWHRFLHSTLVELPLSSRPDNLPETYRRVILSDPTSVQRFDYIANERLHDRLLQTFNELSIETNMEARAVGIDKPAALMPAAYISSEEVHAAISMSGILGYDVATDVTDFSGLRLVEWLRGYAFLKCTADHHLNAVKDGLMVFNKEDLSSGLQRLGLSDASSATFVDHATFGMRSRDLYDCPLIRTSDEKLALFAPAILQTKLLSVVLSNLGRLEEQIGRKGKAFEASVKAHFKKHGIDCLSFKAHRGGEEFEFDALVPWGNFIFLFECKNQSLSNRDPVDAYYFELKRRSNGNQVRRLHKALLDYPDILAGQGIEVSGKTIVPCVLNSLPFSMPGAQDGVYFTDWSVILFFFEERYAFFKTAHRFQGAVKLIHRAGPGCLDSAPLDLSGFLPGYAERGALRFCRCVGRA
ncbi:hypothetical protein G6321_00023640 [Bradyrhizobium barranii subsp. barranii]|uniref:NERD domain-containing protein n=1 Tax=Bradyrhizobium barranii subsp. barranii TaxID=2823807 RepID=A0A7Z0TVH6_9BRAD|nr:hypothetical protein [Bradyrhizobium barranii]UGX97961.1 hypothetical protein G6321_00023640 [Bradyrhizobium barranii subsp. barranii]